MDVGYAQTPGGSGVTGRRDSKSMRSGSGVEGGRDTRNTSERLAVGVARALEQEIIDREWPIGEVLGSETSLRERFGVSRSILREAVRLLENSQVAQMRQGPGGGLVVSVPDPRPTIRGLVISLEYMGASVDQLIVARSIMEGRAVAQIPSALDEAGAVALRESARGITSDSATDFHIVMGQLCGNPVLELYVDVLVRLTAAYTKRADRGVDVDRAELADASARHLEIAEAVVAGDGYRARNLLDVHLEDTARWLDLNVDPIPGEQTATRPMDPDPDERPREKKLAESLAGRIHDDIVDEKRQVGEILGAEPELLERYEVGRSVFREAVRILEYYEVAAMRRGAGGGLVVLPPNPMATVRTLSLYLDYRGVEAEQLAVVRDEIEVGLLGAAMRSRALLAPEADDVPVLAAPAGDCRCSRCFRDRLEGLSNDPVLSLLREVTSVLWERHGIGPRPSDPCCPPQPEECADIESIVEAIRDRDEPLARFRLRRHLRRATGW